MVRTSRFHTRSADSSLVNEIEETQADKIDLGKPYVVLEKLDGLN